MKQGFYENHDGVWIPVLTVSGGLFWSESLEKQLFRGSHCVRYVDSRGGINDTRPQFVSDGGSKPWWAWGLFGHPYDRHFPAYYNHDSEYDKIRQWDYLTWWQRRAERKLADWRFRDAMRWLDDQHGIESLAARIKYFAVRWFGWVSAVVSLEWGEARSAGA